MPELLKIATRKSPLALWQANFVRKSLLQQYPDLSVELVTMTTQGDRILDAPLAKIGGKGLFVKELEQALLDGRADLAVHSMKDVPMQFPEGLGLAAICRREDPRDAFLSLHHATLQTLPLGARVGTSSLRRQCQLRALRPDLRILDLRGNVQTRLERLQRGEYEAIILATAGLLRLELEQHIREKLPETIMLPAVGQGAVGLECRLDNQPLLQRLQSLQDTVTQQCVLAERSMNFRLHGGCQVPIAGFAQQHGDYLVLRGLVGSADGQQILRAEHRAPATEASALGNRVAEDLLQQGAASLLQALYE